VDPLTHVLSGAVLGRALAPHGLATGRVIDPARVPGVAQWTGAVTTAALFPDIDFVLAAVDPLLYLHHHRGLTHSLVMLPLWALLLGGLFAWVTRSPQHRRAYTLAAAFGIGIHVLGDLITPYGTMILAPLSRESFEFGTTFVIDPWLTGLLLAGLAGIWLWRARAAALASLAASALYICMQAVLMSQAVALAEQHAATLRLPAAAASVYPQPLSPFHWKLLVARAHGYETALVSLRRSEPAPDPDRRAGFLQRLHAAYRPAEAPRWRFYPRVTSHGGFVEAAWQHPEMWRFRAFARYPVVERVRQGNSRHCAWFRDLRFDLPGRPAPFRHGMCQEVDAETWTRDQIGVW
jgi:inner membrane protein